MKRSSLGPPKSKHRPVPCATGLERSLSAYAAAASAAGVSLVALQPSAQAKIVYTPANISILVGKPFPLDLNHDGVTDFMFSNILFYLGDRGYGLGVRAAASNPGNAIWGKGITSAAWGSFSRSCRSGFAAALPAGFNVRPNKSYLQKSACWMMGWRNASISRRFEYPYAETLGQWMYTQNRYLGMKFMIDGEAHYGWARFSVTTGSEGAVATLTGYAYETIPNKLIIAGKTKGPDVVTWEPATLGRLAQGASGISAWREKK
jgi:hypothetical protein